MNAITHIEPHVRSKYACPSTYAHPSTTPSSPCVTTYVTMVMRPLPSDTHPTRRPACFPAPAPTSPLHVSSPSSQTDHPHIPSSCVEPLPCAIPMNSHTWTCHHTCSKSHITPTHLGSSRQ